MPKPLPPPKPVSLTTEPEPADPAVAPLLPNSLVSKPPPLKGLKSRTILPQPGHMGIGKLLGL